MYLSKILYPFINVSFHAISWVKTTFWQQSLLTFVKVVQLLYQRWSWLPPLSKNISKKTLLCLRSITTSNSKMSDFFQNTRILLCIKSMRYKEVTSPLRASITLILCLNCLIIFLALHGNVQDKDYSNAVFTKWSYSSEMSSKSQETKRGKV